VEVIEKVLDPENASSVLNAVHNKIRHKSEPECFKEAGSLLNAHRIR
jgi:hypothetical protein